MAEKSTFEIKFLVMVVGTVAIVLTSMFAFFQMQALKQSDLRELQARLTKVSQAVQAVKILDLDRKRRDRIDQRLQELENRIRKMEKSLARRESQ